MNLASKANAIETRISTSPWPDHEHVRGYAVLELPFSSGHPLGVREEYQRTRKHIHEESLDGRAFQSKSV